MSLMGSQGSINLGKLQLLLRVVHAGVCKGELRATSLVTADKLLREVGDPSAEASGRAS